MGYDYVHGGLLGSQGKLPAGFPRSPSCSGNQSIGAIASDDKLKNACTLSSFFYRFKTNISSIVYNSLLIRIDPYLHY